MKKITLSKFISHFGENLRNEKRFCFILGAGASITSGIPTGDKLVNQWIDELKTSDEQDLNQWLIEKNIVDENYACHYSDIFDKRFELSKKNGFAFLEKIMDNAEPSCGYSVLAQILAGGKHNIVITTNFDSLTEDALFIYTQKKPLVIGHASLADYISTNLSRPLIIKIHHDLFFSPKNGVEEVACLDKCFDNKLKDIFKYYTPLVIGYGGNDGSLMNFLGELDHFEEGIFWFYIDGTKPRESIIELVEKHNGYFVPIKGFDELMIQLGDKLEIGRLDTIIEKNAKERAEKYRKQIEDITKANTVDEVTKEALNNITSRGEKTWWSYELKANKEINPEKIKEIYLEGIKEFPNSPELLNNYALFLHNNRKEYDDAETYYQKTIEIKPFDTDYLCNYAIFQNEIRKNFEKAEELYKKAIEIDPNDAGTLGNYALLLEEIKKDYINADIYYTRAIDADKRNTINLCNYADFIVKAFNKYDKAEELYKKAIEIDPLEIINLSNYAIFLSKIRNKDDEAESLYKRIIEINDKDPIISGNYALLLSRFRKNYDKAEEFYKKAIKIDPTNLENTINYANLLTDKKHKYNEAEALYTQALKLDSTDPICLGNYSHLLIISRNDFSNAKVYIDKAFESVPEDLGILSELWFYRYAHYPEYLKQGEQELEKLIEQGAKSIDWNLQAHVDIAAKNGHPDIEKLQLFADLITKLNEE